MPHTFLGQIGFFAMACVCGMSVLLGGRLERRAALWFGWSWMMSILLQQATGRLYPVTAFLTVDSVTLLALAALTWRSERLWPFAVVALQGMQVAVHILRLCFPHGRPLPYLTALNVIGYALLSVVAFATWRFANGLGPALADRWLWRGRFAAPSPPADAASQPSVSPGAQK